MPIADDITLALASCPVLAATVKDAALAFEAAVETALPAADRSTFETLFLAAVNEISSLAHPNAEFQAKLKADVKSGVHKVAHLFGTLTRDVADAIDPTATTTTTVTPAATSATEPIAAAAGKTS